MMLVLMGCDYLGVFTEVHFQREMLLHHIYVTSSYLILCRFKHFICLEDTFKFRPVILNFLICLQNQCVGVYNYIQYVCIYIVLKTSCTMNSLQQLHATYTLMHYC